MLSFLLQVKSIKRLKLNKARINSTPILYGGELKDVREQLATTTFLVLPTFYNEGTPKILIEGAAMGTPLITTDTPGCRSLVNGNGFLVTPNSLNDLYDCMKIASRVGKEKLSGMSFNSPNCRVKFSEKIVIGEYLNAINFTKFS